VAGNHGRSWGTAIATVRCSGSASIGVTVAYADGTGSSRQSARRRSAARNGLPPRASRWSMRRSTLHPAQPAPIGRSLPGRSRPAAGSHPARYRRTAASRVASARASGKRVRAGSRGGCPSASPTRLLANSPSPPRAGGRPAYRGAPATATSKSTRVAAVTQPAWRRPGAAWASRSANRRATRSGPPPGPSIAWSHSARYGLVMGSGRWVRARYGSQASVIGSPAAALSPWPRHSWTRVWRAARMPRMGPTRPVQSSAANPASAWSGR